MRIDFEWQQTIQQEITYTGTGLHTGGQEINVTCRPLTVDSGIRFKRVISHRSRR